MTSRCPDCASPLSYRVQDEDTGLFYPVDEGEHYCRACECTWIDEDLDDLRSGNLGFTECGGDPLGEAA